ncbi:hypothetical protein [Meiothermus ruber]|uniref:Uncharacterized protein n=1 Tax=Meiothermus ruber (strain ATCC 35948 / DSM 1279 / VKM B-1258 / 21) TaxID=504728 RepID=D3PTF8_MEIRD|nr:hypothetical protein [Meiothermus ruber]ADD28741.1 hypothetical protein Mrub_1985 [Meiothermus ruber DSM 1279]AGK05811.1 hypothetical protein K649_12625 [Meiothermus ruber DSM 1279]
MEKPTKRQTFEQSQDALEAITSNLHVEPHQQLYFFLHDLATDLIYAARQLKEHNELEPAELRRIARRAMAAYVASLELFGVTGPENEDAVRDILRNPHRMKGVETP